MKILGIIPARYGSTRLEGKPLLDIGGRSMIEHVYSQAKKVHELNDLVVATDDDRIMTHCSERGIPAVITSSQHQNGTERVAEALQLLSKNYDLVVNIQGDEPFVHPQSIIELISTFNINSTAQIATLKKKITVREDLFNPSIIKVVTDNGDKAIYFSRNSIPYLRDRLEENWLENFVYYKHIGLYAYKSDVLMKLIRLEPTSLELAEKLEQLRWLENGYNIYVSETEFESKSIDTIEDYQFILQNYQRYV